MRRKRPRAAPHPSLRHRDPTQQPHRTQLRAECEPLRAQVQLRMSRPLSKNKSHVVQAIVKKEDGSEPPHPFPTVPL